MNPRSPDASAEAHRTEAQPRIPAPVSDAMLAVPKGWLIDPISVERLTRRLSAAGPECAGIGAEHGELAPGASYRVAAERAAMAPASATSPAASGVIAGAALLRPGVAFELGDGSVVTGADSLLIDPGSVSFDPWTPVGRLQHASLLGRPPFPYRPVAMFLGLEADPDLADWVRSTVNNLVRGNTEGRIAVPEPTGGLHLTRPCLPSAASVQALAPDVVVALDEEAAEKAERWLGDDRAATIVQLTQDTTNAIELVSWRVGNAQGRLRARIGRGADAAGLAELFRRLCAGPQPTPPRNRPAPGVRIRARRGRRTSAAQTSIVALTGTGADADRRRFEGFADHAAGAGAEMVVGRIGDPASSAASTADVLFLRSASRHDEAHALVAERSGHGLRTVVDLGAGDLEFDPTRPQEPPTLTAEARRLVGSAGLATSSGVAVRSAARAEGARTLLLPTLATTGRVAELQQLRNDYHAGEWRRVGWHTGAEGTQPSAGDRALAAAIPALLAGHPRLSIEIVGGATHIADTLDAHPHLWIAPGSPRADQVVRWTAQLWTGSAFRSEVDGDLRPAVEAHLLGVPTVLRRDHPAFVDGLIPASLMLDDSPATGVWSAVERLLSDPFEHARRSLEVQRLAVGLYGTVPARTLVNRVLGWLRFEAGT